MDKFLPVLRQVASVLAKMNPVPFLDSVERDYGRTVRLVLQWGVLIAAVSLLGYQFGDVTKWLGLQ